MSGRMRQSLWLGLVMACGCAPPRQPTVTPVPERPSLPPPRAVLGLILPQSGSAGLQQYGELVLQGVRLAVDSTTVNWSNPPELVVLDDAGDPERDAALLGQLERRGAVGIIGPLLSAGLASAARARADTALVLISPTASSVPSGLPNTYSVNEPDTRGAAALAAYALRQGVLRVALLYPAMEEYQTKARAFQAAFRAAGGTVVADVPYDSGTTTFRNPLRRVATANPDGLYIPAPERDVRQLAPQLSYYGVTGRGLRVFGGESWTSDEILRLVPARYTNGIIASTPLVQESQAAGWQEFARLYERTYRRSLDTPFPGLGYDAARLLLSVLPRTRTRPADVARRIAAERAFRGATGVLTVRNGEILREPFIVRLEEGKLVTLQAPGAGATSR